jgi:hypothetical protein
MFSPVIDDASCFSQISEPHGGGEPAITVDSLEVAQFFYLLLNNTKIRDVIETIGKKKER